MRSFIVKAKNFESAQALFDALAGFAPHMTGNDEDGYAVSIDPVGGDRHILAVLDAIQAHVQE